jgi:hypothetical protein
MKKFVFAAMATVALVGFAMAEEFTAVITKCDSDKGCIEYKKGKKDEAKEGKADLAKNCKIAKGTFNKDDKKFTAGDAIEKGLANEIFTKAEKGVFARITIADDGADKGKVTQILVIQKKKAGGQ